MIEPKGSRKGTKAQRKVRRTTAEDEYSQIELTVSCAFGAFV